jgi:addiction module HigA family antidote
MISTHRPPTHPGEMLLKEFLLPMNVTQKEFCQHLNWPYARINEIIHGRRNITADSALALGEALKMEPEFWLNLQKNWDLWQAEKKHVHVKPFHIRLSTLREQFA